MGYGYDYGFWFAVVIYSGITLMFVVGFIRPRRRREWKSMGVVGAFFVSLFTEMFGFPLTIYTLTSVFGFNMPVLNPYAHESGHMLASFGLGVEMAALFCQLGSLIFYLGMLIIGIGWWQIHRGDGELVTGGIYRFIRHPQYLGMFLLTTGMMIQWPTIPTLIMWPILLINYYRLSQREDNELIDEFGDEYEEYRQKTPAFLPLKLS